MSAGVWKCFGAQSVQCVSGIQRLRLHLKDKTELCTPKPFVCSAVCFFLLSLSHSFFFLPVSEVAVNAFGMTQADMCVHLCVCVCALACVCLCVRDVTVAYLCSA